MSYRGTMVVPYQGQSIGRKSILWVSCWAMLYIGLCVYHLKRKDSKATHFRLLWAWCCIFLKMSVPSEWQRWAVHSGSCARARTKTSPALPSPLPRPSSAEAERQEYRHPSLFPSRGGQRGWIHFQTSTHRERLTQGSKTSLLRGKPELRLHTLIFPITIQWHLFLPTSKTHTHKILDMYER